MSGAVTLFPPVRLVGADRKNFISYFPWMGHAVAHLVEVLHDKSEGRGFDTRWCYWNFSLTQSFRPYYGPGVDSTSNINEYQEYFLRGKRGRCVGLTTLPLSCADNFTTFVCRLSWNQGASTSWNPQSLSRPVMGLLYIFIFLEQNLQRTLKTFNLCSVQPSTSFMVLGII
jgi:hypothetical protein